MSGMHYPEILSKTSKSVYNRKYNAFVYGGNETTDKDPKK